MQTSFISIDNISQYFQGTLAFLEDELAYIVAVSCDTNADGYELLVSYNIGNINRNERKVFYVKGYDEALNYIKSFLPPTRYFKDDKGTDWLCSYSPMNNYKKSLCRPRYKKMLPRFVKEAQSLSTEIPMSPTCYNDVVSRTIHEAMEDSSESALKAMSPHFALYDGNKARYPIILYNHYPIAVVNNYGIIEPHPRYFKTFERSLQRFGEVRYVDQRSV